MSARGNGAKHEGEGIVFTPDAPEQGVRVSYKYRDFAEPSSMPNRVGSGRITASRDVLAAFAGKQPLMLRTDEDELDIELLNNGDFYVVIVQ